MFYGYYNKTIDICPPADCGKYSIGAAYFLTIVSAFFIACIILVYRLDNYSHVNFILVLICCVGFYGCVVLLQHVQVLCKRLFSPQVSWKSGSKSLQLLGL